MKKVLSSFTLASVLSLGFLTCVHAEPLSSSKSVEHTTRPSNPSNDISTEHTLSSDSSKTSVLKPIDDAGQTSNTSTENAVVEQRGFALTESISNTKTPTNTSKNQDSNNQEIQRLKETQNTLILKIEALTKELYLSNPKFGEKNGPGYFYRFSKKNTAQKTFNGFYYSTNSLVAKKKNSDVSPVVEIKPNDFVTFSLKESLPDGTVVSNTPIITVLNDRKLPDIVKAAFDVGSKNEMVTIVALARQVYSIGERNDYPKGVTPDTSLIYSFRILDVHNSDSQEMNVLKPR